MSGSQHFQFYAILGLQKTKYQGTKSTKPTFCSVTRVILNLILEMVFDSILTETFVTSDLEKFKWETRMKDYRIISVSVSCLRAFDRPLYGREDYKR